MQGRYILLRFFLVFERCPRSLNGTHSNFATCWNWKCAKIWRSLPPKTWSPEMPISGGSYNDIRLKRKYLRKETAIDRQKQIFTIY